MKIKTAEEHYQEYLEIQATNDIDVSLKNCPLCNSNKCNAYVIVVNNRTYLIVSQCRKIKIIENNKDKEDYWDINFDNFLNPIKRKLEDVF